MIGVFLVIILVGVGLYFVNANVPMAPPVKTILNVAVIICLCLWLLAVFGVADIPIQRVR